MKRLISNILLFFFVANILSAQTADSLLQILPNTKGEERAGILVKLSESYVKTDKTKSLNYAKEAVEISEENEFESIQADAYFQLGNAHYRNDNFWEAIEYSMLAKEYYRSLGDSLNVARSCNILGRCFGQTSEFDKAVKNYFEALRIYERNEKINELALIYSSIGLVHLDTKNYRKAISFFRQASIINKSTNNVINLARNYSGIGGAYFYQNEYDSAKVYYTKSLEIFRVHDYLEEEAIALNNIANVFLQTNDSLRLAAEYYNNALSVFRKLNLNSRRASVLLGIGGVWRRVEETEKALRAYNHSLKIIEENNLGYYHKQLVYHNLALAYEGLGNAEKAYAAFKNYHLYNDSLLNKEKLEQAAELEKKYQTEKKEAEIERLNAVEEVHLLRLERGKQVRLFGAILIVLLVGITIYISYQYYNKKKTNLLLSQKNVQIELQRKELEKLNAAKNKFFSIIAHDLKNPFHTVMGYSYLMHKDYKRFKDKEREKYAEDIYKSTNTIFRLLQNLLDWSRTQTGRLNFNPQKIYISDLYENIYSVLKPVADAKRIELKNNICSDDAVWADPMMVETILRNLVNNAIKFSKNDSQIEIADSKLDGYLELSVIDNGIGIKPDDVENLFKIDSKVKQKGTNNEDGSGLGLILCKEFIEKNNGTIAVESEFGKGSKFSIRLPLFQVG